MRPRRLRHAESDELHSPASPQDCVVISVAIAPYRASFLAAVESLHPRMRFVFRSGREHFDPSIRVAELSSIDSSLRNLYLFGRKLLFQIGSQQNLKSAAIAVVELNPRVISSWIVLLRCRVQGTPSLVWGHAWPRAGSGSRRTILRDGMCRIASGIVAYTEADAMAFRGRIASRKVYVVPNSVLSEHDMKPVPRNGVDIICVGRLVDEKRPDLLLEAFERVADAHPEASLHFVGSGPLLASLVERAIQMDSASRIQFHGEVNEPELLAEIYARSAFSVLPGTAGLSVTQSLGWGVPVLLADSGHHGPEAASANAAFARRFKAGDERDLAIALESMWGEVAANRFDSAAMSAQMSRLFSVEHMALAFVEGVADACA